jgi:hypothetical protein
MKIRIVATGEVLDVESRDYWVIFQKCGLIEFVAAAVEPKKRGVAEWFIHDASTDKSLPTVVARCPECHASQVFCDPPRVLRQGETETENSPLRRAFLEHCKRRDLIPEHIVTQYYEVLNGIRR